MVLGRSIPRGSSGRNAWRLEEAAKSIEAWAEAITKGIK